jgi:hypothetical protein
MRAICFRGRTGSPALLRAPHWRDGEASHFIASFDTRTMSPPHGGTYGGRGKAAVDSTPGRLCCLRLTRAAGSDETACASSSSISQE